MKGMVNFTVQSRAEDFPHYWETCVGSCHAYTALREDWRAQVRKAHDELGFKYVRFHGLFDDDMSVCYENVDFDGNSQGIVYNFVNVDNIVDFLLSIGMKPFFELGFMPSCLASGDRTFGAYRGNVTLPKDESLWAELIERFALHLLDRYGEAEVESWFFEVWNEPNLALFFAGSKQDYFHLYEITARALKRVDDKLRVGGPATSFNSWIPDMVDFCETNEVPLDFISTHHYPADDPLWKGGVDISEFFKNGGSEASDYHRGVLRDMALRARQEAKNYPLYYTEWNSSVMHDDPYAAAFVAKTLVDNSGLVEGYSYWCVSDIFEEFSQTPGVFHDGFGLQTYQGIEKPAYRIFEIFHQLGTQRIEVTSSQPDSTVELLAVRDGDDLQLVAYNHNIPGKTIDTQTISVQLPACIGADNTAGCLERIDDDHANAKKQWKAMGKPEYPDSRQVKELRAASELQNEQVTVSSGKLTFDMPPQSCAFVVIDNCFKSRR
ncbi:hypothetical protein OZX67_00745 [Bifidobacterium sp. ESL0728]|uniref:GH39 family glycosyl hydrolase n=1 Tax=Bifidobacterium sp. ESL0728 TaxID=2983220 RepID=UPI0023F8BB01|nr:hypothetical protein [Bifidobacterium sp. ESL0728]WEV59137.1 hypothetical protein OZX67_00745 [Bifidobacterium sp. ESL0728]